MKNLFEMVGYVIDQTYKGTVMAVSVSHLYVHGCTLNMCVL